MGISGLWDAVAPEGKVILPKNLENKVMAIDGSFWIKYISASRENGKYDSDFISIFFKRVCKLLSYKIIPIIVFDGIAPDAKRSEINHRMQSMSKYSERHRRLTLKRIAKQALMKQLFPSNKNVEPIEKESYEIVKKESSPNNTLFDPNDSSSSSDYDNNISSDKFNEMSPIDKFNYLKGIQQRSFNDDRTQLMDFSGSISEFSDKLLGIYMKNANVNKLLDKVKLELNVKNLPQLENDHSQSSTSSNPIHNVWLDSEDIIKDYNTLIPTINSAKKRRFLNDFDIINNSDLLPLKDMKSSSNNDDDLIKFNCDSELFGEDFISDTSDLDKGKSPIDNVQNSSSDEWEELARATDKDPIVNFEIPTIEPENLDYQCEFTKTDSPIDFPDEDFYDFTSIYPEEFKSDNLKDSDHGKSQIISDLSSNIHRLINSQEFDSICSLLKLFKIPIIFAPSEAEAQCAQLSIEDSVYGVISDDSDTIAFGAHRVIKNFFNKQRNLELYQSEDIRINLGLTREKLCLIAMLCGCDYTSGIKGIGIVNALEVIEAYPKFDDLYEFRDWATSICSDTSDSCEVRHKYKVKHEKTRNSWIFNVDFPNVHAYNLLMSPKVDLNLKIPEFKNTKLDTQSMESIALFMRDKSRLSSNEIIGHLNELNRCLNNNLLAGQLRLYDLDGIKSHIKMSSNTPDHTVIGGDTTVAYIKSERMKSSITGLKNTSNYVN